MTVALSPLFVGYQVLNHSGLPNAGGFIYVYQAGTSTPATTYTDSSGTIANTNPIQLDAAGYIPDQIWVDPGSSYKFVVESATGTILGTYDNIPGWSALNIGFSVSSTAPYGTVARALVDRGICVTDAPFNADPTGTNDSTNAFDSGFAAATGSPLIAYGGPYKTTALSSLGGILQWSNGIYNASVTRQDPVIASNLSAAPVLTYTSGSAYAYATRNGSLTGANIYEAIFPGVSQYETSQSVLQLTSGSTIDNAAAVGGFVYNDSTADGVALFGVAQAAVDNAKVWGVNTLIQDAASRVAGSGVGRVAIGAELDFNIMNPGTEVIGVSVGGNSLAQPTTANGFQVTALGTGYYWQTGFLTQDGAATNALSIGLASATLAANGASQLLLFQYGDGSGVKRSIEINAQGGGYLTVSSLAGSFPGLFVEYGNINISSGQAYQIAGNNVLTGQASGYGTPTGNAYQPSFNATTITLPNLAAAVAQLILDLKVGKMPTT